MRYVSLFSGIEAASVAWDTLGWEPMAFAEIDDFPSAVLAEHFPDVPNLGSVVDIDWSEFIESSGRPDVVVGGSPCQSFSIAGKRDGLKGESGLMFEYIRAVQELCPEWFVWENVPGALTSEHGAAFKQLLSEMDALGYGLAWRVLDAQFFGVAQRRERLFLVGHLGAESPAEILFEREGMPWDFETVRKKREKLAARAGRGANGSGGGAISMADTQAHAAIENDHLGTLTAHSGKEPPVVCRTFTCEMANTTSNGLGVYESSVTPTLGTRESVAVYAIQGNAIDRSERSGCCGRGFDAGGGQLHPHN